jgi:hypothetical protein
MTSAVLALPLFFAYQVGILLGVRGRNGVDFISSALVRLCDRDLTTYLQLLSALALGYALLVIWLRGRGRFDPRSFVPLLMESAVYGFFMGGVIQLIIVRFSDIIPILGLPALVLGNASPGEVIVVSAGAGLHEELVFRVLLMGGMIRLFALPGIPIGRSAGFVNALVVSSLIFSAVHHMGPAGEAFTALAFVYRSLAGILFGLIYHWRGFAVAAWTHTLYDVFVFTLA